MAYLFLQVACPFVIHTLDEIISEMKISSPLYENTYFAEPELNTSLQHTALKHLETCAIFATTTYGHNEHVRLSYTNLQCI